LLSFNISVFPQILDILSLAILTTDGKIITRHGQNDISCKGWESIYTWLKGEKVLLPPPDE